MCLLISLYFVAGGKLIFTAQAIAAENLMQILKSKDILEFQI